MKGPGTLVHLLHYTITVWPNRAAVLIRKALSRRQGRSPFCSVETFVPILHLATCPRTSTISRGGSSTVSEEATPRSQSDNDANADAETAERGCTSDRSSRGREHRG